MPSPGKPLKPAGIKWSGRKKTQTSSGGNLFKQPASRRQRDADNKNEKGKNDNEKQGHRWTNLFRWSRTFIKQVVSRLRVLKRSPARRSDAELGDD